MTYVPLWQLADELGCDSAYALLVEPRFHHLDLGTRFFYDGQPVYINRNVGDSTTILFDAFVGPGCHDLRLTHSLANQLSVDVATYFKHSKNPIQFKVEDIERKLNSEDDSSKSSNKTSAIVLLTLGAVAAMVVYRSGILDAAPDKKTNTKK